MPAMIRPVDQIAKGCHDELFPTQRGACPEFWEYAGVLFGPKDTTRPFYPTSLRRTRERQPRLALIGRLHTALSQVQRSEG